MFEGSENVACEAAVFVKGIDGEDDCGVTPDRTRVGQKKIAVCLCQEDVALKMGSCGVIANRFHQVICMKIGNAFNLISIFLTEVDARRDIGVNGDPFSVLLSEVIAESATEAHSITLDVGLALHPSMNVLFARLINIIPDRAEGMKITEDGFPKPFGRGIRGASKDEHRIGVFVIGGDQAKGVNLIFKEGDVFDAIIHHLPLLINVLKEAHFMAGGWVKVGVEGDEIPHQHVSHKWVVLRPDHLLVEVGKDLFKATPKLRNDGRIVFPKESEFFRIGKIDVINGDIVIKKQAEEGF